MSSSADAAMTGKSREFSTYLLAYSDKKSGKKDDPDKGDSGDKKDKKDKKKSGGSADTGDGSDAGLFLMLGGLSFICALGALYFGRIKKRR